MLRWKPVPVGSGAGAGCAQIQLDLQYCKMGAIGKPQDAPQQMVGVYPILSIAVGLDHCKSKRSPGLDIQFWN